MEATSYKQDLWDKLTDKLQGRLTTPGYKTFISSAKLMSLEEGVLTLAVPNEFILSWIKERCELVVQEIFSEEFKQTIVLHYIVNPDFNFDDAKPATAAVPATSVINKPITAPESTPTPAQQIKTTLFNSKYTFDTFVVGHGNRFAQAAAKAVAEAPAKAYNPLFTYGGSGLGKTHLMHAIGQHALSLNPNLKIVYVNAEDFVNEMIEAIQDGQSRKDGQSKINLFRNKYRTVDMLMIDDIQFLMGKERSQEEFFHSFNSLYEAKKQIILNSDRPPKDLQNIEDRLISRFSWGLITDIQPPDLETRIAILRNKVSSDGLSVPEDVLQYIASQIQNNIRDLEGAINRIVAHSSLSGINLSVEFASETLKNLINVKQDKHTTISIIKQVVSEYYNIDIEELSAKGRTKEIAMARQIAMYLAKDLTPSSLAKIGSNFGGRDHTTVLHACDKIKESIKGDLSFAETINTLKKNCLK